MNDELKLKNNLKEARAEKKLSQTQLTEMIGVSRNTTNGNDRRIEKHNQFH